MGGIGMRKSMMGIANIAAMCLGLGLPATARAHCDTMAGPVVMTAKKALEKGDVTPVLKWVKKDDEAEIRAAFNKALAARTQGKEAQEVADQYFFETLVRIHRAGEGAPFTGLKPVGAELDPAVEGADKALATGSVAELVKMVNEDVSAGIRKRFVHVQETAKHADESVEAGRSYVAAYIEFTHYVERLHLDAMGSAAGHGEAGGESATPHGH